MMRMGLWGLLRICWLIGRVENGLEGDLHDKDGWSSCL